MKNNCCYACHWTKPGPEEGTWVPSCADAACKCHKEEVAAPKASGWEEEFEQEFPEEISRSGDVVTRYNLINRHEVKDFIRELLASDRASRLKAVLERIEGMKRMRKPTHGPCCTRQTCGYSIADMDECECARNKMLDDLAEEVRNLK